MNEPAHEVFMRLAIGQAELALARGDGPIGCVVVRDSEVIARAGNMVYSTGCKLDHAETVAIRACSSVLWQDAPECTLYTTLEPCVMCLGAIAFVRIGNVVYGEADPEHGGSDAHTRVPYVRRCLNCYLGGVLAHECADLRSKWVPPESIRKA
jgi:tRNA(adenine34) deaminase